MIRFAKIFPVLLLILAIGTAVNPFLPQGDFLPDAAEQDLPATKEIFAVISVLVILIVYGGLGWLGYWLSQKLNWAAIWDANVNNRQRFIIPAVTGIGLGVFFIVVDSLVGSLHELGPLQHPPFPTSLIASLNAAIGEEIIFRLFFIPFWVWLFARVLFKRGETTLFWIISIVSALVFAVGHFPSVMIMYGLDSVAALPVPLVVELIVLNVAVSIPAALFLRNYGLLAAIGVHFWVDIVWHVIWGVF